MSSSPTHNVESLTLSELWIAFQNWQGNVSLDESLTLMEEFTCIASSTSDGSFEVEKLMYSMWEVSTQTLAALVAIRKRATITQSRMETLYAEGLPDPHLRCEVEMALLIQNGLRLHRLKIETSFGNWCTSWILRVQQLLFPNFRNTAIGNLRLMLPRMSHQQELSSLEERLTVETIGFYNLESDLRNHS